MFKQPTGSQDRGMTNIENEHKTNNKMGHLSPNTPIIKCKWSRKEDWQSDRKT